MGWNNRELEREEQYPDYEIPDLVPKKSGTWGFARRFRIPGKIFPPKDSSIKDWFHGSRKERDPVPSQINTGKRRDGSLREVSTTRRMVKWARSNNSLIVKKFVEPKTEAQIEIENEMKDIIAQNQTIEDVFPNFLWHQISWPKALYSTHYKILPSNLLGFVHLSGSQARSIYKEICHLTKTGKPVKFENKYDRHGRRKWLNRLGDSIGLDWEKYHATLFEAGFDMKAAPPLLPPVHASVLPYDNDIVNRVFSEPTSSFQHLEETLEMWEFGNPGFSVQTGSFPSSSSYREGRKLC